MCLRPIVRLSPRFSASSSPSARSFFSASLVAAMRVMEISSGRTGSTERAKPICTGPAHLAGVDAGGQHGAEGADVEEIVAHEAAQTLRPRRRISGVSFLVLS